jgi:UDP-glucuronate 4-epimerase
MTCLGRVLVTGGAGFIGSHVCERMLGEGWRVTALDSFDNYYDPSIKWANIRLLQTNPDFDLVVADIRDPIALESELGGSFDLVVHLAARAGVRPSIQDPVTYTEVNVTGTQNLLEFCRSRGVGRFIFASSSSVYGVNANTPWREDDHVLLPISPYASTKVSGELLGHVYSHLFGIQFLALRFFTVFGPRQRPDLAIHRFARLIQAGEQVPLYGDGSTRRDYTYVADIVDGILGAAVYQNSNYEVVNLGNNVTTSLLELVGLLEEVLGKRARVVHLPEQPGDVPITWASIEKAERLFGYSPKVNMRDGLSRFAEWLAGQQTMEG